MSTAYRKPDQIIQPYWFGHLDAKRTCLWLKGLPPLVPTSRMPKPATGWKNLTPSGNNKVGEQKDRAKIRSRTYKGIATAMAMQWGVIAAR
jgi:hypothetical protein